MRLSMPTTEYPRSRRYSERCDPMNPAPPVTSARGTYAFVLGEPAIRGDSLYLFSVRVLLPEPAEQGQDQDLDVQEQRPVLDVVQVVLDPLLDRRVAAPAVHLGPPRDPALHAMAEHVLGDALLELLHERRPLRARADQAHVPEHDVDELRELVEVEPPQPDPERRAARVLGRGPDRPRVPLRLVDHRPELVYLEGPAVEGHALLAQEHWSPAAPGLDEGRDGQEDGDEGEKGRGADHGIHDPLDHAVPAPQRDLAEADDGDAVEVLEHGLDRRVLDEVGHDLDVQALVAHALDELEELGVLVEGQRDVELVRVVAGRHLRGLGE